jgi:hypothetical protein
MKHSGSHLWIWHWLLTWGGTKTPSPLCDFVQWLDTEQSSFAWEITWNTLVPTYGFARGTERGEAQERSRRDP